MKQRGSGVSVVAQGTIQVEAYGVGEGQDSSQGVGSPSRSGGRGGAWWAFGMEPTLVWVRADGLSQLKTRDRPGGSVSRHGGHRTV